MTQLRGSEKFIWSLSDVLGQGATGAVYKGRHKRTGDVVAVKTFNHMSQMRPKDVQMREFEVMRKLNHENIVRLLAIENETGSQTQVIVMELCTGGSLYNMLDNPVNAYGIKEEEFFVVLNDVGLKHLNDNNMVHRDIKPGNIMRYIYEDGRSVYKLTDFGAARELNEEEEFMSLYGTEEYLYPDMYERAVLRRHTAKAFDASVDLWSLGVTLYHLASGQLPFRPFGGRKNKEMMYHITITKESGVISGVQEELDGPVKWSKTLPSTCTMSKGGRKLVRPLLAGLMECDANAMWNFDKFFKYVKHVYSLLAVHIFDLCHGQALRVYVQKNNNLTKIHEEIAEQTDIHPSHQNLLLNNCPLSQLVTPLRPVETYPKTSPNNPILLFYNEPSNCPQLAQFEIPATPKISNTVDLDKDPSLAKTITGLMYYLKSGVDRLLSLQTILVLAADMYYYVLKCSVDNLHNQVEQFCRHFAEISVRLQSSVTNQQLHQQMLDQMISLRGGDQKKPYLQQLECCSTAQLQGRHEQLSVRVKELEGDFGELYQTVVVAQSLRHQWNNSEQCNKEGGCLSTSISLAETVNQTWSDFKRDRSLKKLSFNEDQIHRFEKNRMRANCTKNISLAMDHCYANSVKMFSSFNSWYRKAFGESQKLQNTKHKLSELGNMYQAFIHDLEQTEKKYSLASRAVLNGLTSSNNKATSKTSPEEGTNKDALTVVLLQQIVHGVDKSGCVTEETKSGVESNAVLLDQLGRYISPKTRNAHGEDETNGVKAWIDFITSVE